MTRSSSTQHFPGLDALRGIAALAVVFLHGAQLCETSYVPHSAILAVDFFFLLSGFVVACAYDGRLNAHVMSMCQFMVARLIRLYPMLFIGTAVGGLVFALSQFQKHEFDMSTTLLMTIGSFALLPVGLAVGVPAYPINNPVWSLFFELIVNALYGSRFGRLARSSLVALVVASAIALIVVAEWAAPYDQIGYASPGTFVLGVVRVSYPFWAGVLLFRLAQLRALPKVPITILSGILLLGIVMPFNGASYCLMLGLVVFPVLIAFGSCAAVGGLSMVVGSALGRLSYPLYLVHQPVFRMIHGTADMMHLAIPAWVMFVAGSVVAVVAAQALLVTFDEPLRVWLGRLTRQRGPEIISVAVPTEGAGSR